MKIIFAIFTHSLVSFFVVLSKTIKYNSTMQSKHFALFVFLILVNYSATQSYSTLLSYARIQTQLNQQAAEEEINHQSNQPTFRRVIYAPGYCEPPMKMDRFGHCRIVW